MVKISIIAIILIIDFCIATSLLDCQLEEQYKQRGAIRQPVCAFLSPTAHVTAACDSRAMTTIKKSENYAHGYWTVPQGMV